MEITQVLTNNRLDENYFDTFTHCTTMKRVNETTRVTNLTNVILSERSQTVKQIY